MAVFEYKAIDAAGKNKRGVIEADSVRSARQRLKNDGLFPTDVIETETAGGPVSIMKLSFGGPRVNTEQLGIATRQLSTLAAAGMPLVDALRALSDQVEQVEFRRVIAEVADKVNEGSTLAKGLREYPRIFPRLYVNMVASGEASGTLDIVLERLAELLEANAQLRRKVFSALTYPILMLVLCFLVILILLGYVVPQITEIFAEQKAALPLPTQIVIKLSDIVKHYWWLITGVVAAIVIGLKKYAATTAGRKQIDRYMLRAPLFGPLMLKASAGRFARNLGAMLDSGIELMQALKVAQTTIGNTALEEVIEKAADGVREGRSLAAELKAARAFPILLVHMVAIGESSGELGNMLLRAATSFESEVDATVAGLTSLLEPLLILVLAVMVGGILASVMLPLLEMSSLAH